MKSLSYFKTAMLAMAITTLGNLIVQFPDRTNLSAA
jgi:hypothetical protein